MAGKNTAAFAIFPSRIAAERAVDALTAAGFPHQDVSVLMSDKGGSKEFATEKHTKAPEGTAAGVSVGGIVGGTLGLLAGIGALAIPGVGPLIAAGPIMGALAGLGVGGAVGGLVGALIGMGIPEYEAKRYEHRVNDGGILVSVHCESSREISIAKDIFRDQGGEDIASSGESSAGRDNAGHEGESRRIEERLPDDRLADGRRVEQVRVDDSRLNDRTVDDAAYNERRVDPRRVDADGNVIVDRPLIERRY